MGGPGMDPDPVAKTHYLVHCHEIVPCAGTAPRVAWREGRGRLGRGAARSIYETRGIRGAKGAKVVRFVGTPHRRRHRV